MSQVEPPVRRVRNAHYPIAFRQEAGRLVHMGHSVQAVTAQLGLGQTTWHKWVRHTQAAPTLLRRSSVFTPAQKHQIARALRTGQLTEDEALRKYSIRLKRTLRQWVAEQTVVEDASYWGRTRVRTENHAKEI